MTQRDEEVSQAQPRRRSDAEPRERRRGPSRLSSWSPRRLALAWIVWPALVLGLIALGAVVSLLLSHNTDSLRTAFTRSNLIGLVSVLVLPPACLTLQWWRMYHRRHGRPPISS